MRRLQCRATLQQRSPSLRVGCSASPCTSPYKGRPTELTRNNGPRFQDVKHNCRCLCFHTSLHAGFAYPPPSAATLWETPCYQRLWSDFADCRAPVRRKRPDPGSASATGWRQGAGSRSRVDRARQFCGVHMHLPVNLHSSTHFGRLRGPNCGRHCHGLKLTDPHKALPWGGPLAGANRNPEAPRP